MHLDLEQLPARGHIHAGYRVNSSRLRGGSSALVYVPRAAIDTHLQLENVLNVDALRDGFIVNIAVAFVATARTCDCSSSMESK